MKLKEYDVVRLRLALPEHSLPAGAIGTVVMVYDTPPGYEIEFCDEEGVTLALVSLAVTDADRLVERGRGGRRAARVIRLSAALSGAKLKNVQLRARKELMEAILRLWPD
jgi:hypothetical protein